MKAAPKQVMRAAHERPCFKFIGGALPLDFANTVGFHAAAEKGEKLQAYGDLLAWGRQAGLLTPREAKRLTAQAVERPHAARLALRRALELREAIYRLFTPPRSAPGSGADLAVLNDALALSAANLRIDRQGSRYGWTWVGQSEGLAGMLGPIARSTAELLTSTDIVRVRQCESSDGCGWLFLDTSRNGRRRWCDMADCGNRAKARRFYRRQRRARQPV